MKKHIALSAIAVGYLGLSNLQAADNLSSLFKDGKVSGQIREYSISRSVDNSSTSKRDYTRKANAIGGHLTYETADFKGLSAGVAFYTTNGFTNDFARDEKYQDYNGSNTFSAGDGLYNGIPCKHPTNCPTNANNLAENSNFLIHVRASKVLIMAANHPNISLYQITSGSSCLDSNGHISTANCTNVAGSTVNFSTGTQTLSFWVMLEDTAAKCQVSSADTTRVDSVNPNSSTCTYAIRQSVPTGSSVFIFFINICCFSNFNLKKYSICIR